MPEAILQDTSLLAARLRVVLARTARRLRTPADTGLSPSLAAALLAVASRGPLTPSELAGCEGVTRPSATRLVACLEQDGLVSRADDPNDGRSYRLGITPKGQALLVSSPCCNNAYLARGLSVLDADDLGALERAAEILERMLDRETA